MQFLRTLNLPQLAARSVREYVHIARALVSPSPTVTGHNPFYMEVKAQLVRHKHLIWADMQVCLCVCVCVSLSLSLSHTHYLSHTQ